MTTQRVDNVDFEELGVQQAFLLPTPAGNNHQRGQGYSELFLRVPGSPKLLYNVVLHGQCDLSCCRVMVAG